MHRAFKALVLSTVIILGVLGFAPRSFGQNPQITVSVFSDVPVSPQLLVRAEQQTGKIFSISGLDIVWIDCTGAHAADGDRDRACLKRYGPDDLIIRITSHVSTVPSDAFGVAFLASDGRGRYADVFWTQTQELSASSNRAPDRILGSVMAHEMGHLLLGLHSHSVSGVMRAHWGRDELQRMEMGTLLFLPEQGKRMRARIADTSSARASTGSR